VGKNGSPGPKDCEPEILRHTQQKISKDQQDFQRLQDVVKSQQVPESILTLLPGEFAWTGLLIFSNLLTDVQSTSLNLHKLQ
jgi:hypothetical protein